ncbi:MAG TPA: hypothetical protein VK806_09070 [Bacteroidia bacterium]|nr:hypothetical protein [Bacteroidia bacterium]
MKFPAKNIKLKPGNTGVSNNPLRKEFLDDLPSKARNTIRGTDLTLINEALAAISDGTATFNGKAPKTRFERYVVIGTYFKTARTPLNMFFDGPVNVQDKCTIAFNFKEQPVVVKFPETLLAI